jgi:sulfide:quinone oxidoreductase
MTILIAGSGVAAVECALALRGHADVELLSPAAELHYRPASVTTPFGGAPAARIDLGGLGVRHHRDALAAVEVGRHRVLTRDGIARPYETLVVATGARSRDAVPGAITFRGAPSAGRVERALAAGGRRVVFAAPPGPHWLLPLYELALQAAGRADVTVVTDEHEPLEAFGESATAAVRDVLERAGVELVTGAAVVAAVDGALRLDDGRLLPADVVVALPEIVGPRIPGLPHDARGFIPVDEHGRVCHDVYAAGDVTAYPVKHGGLAAQQADAVAGAIIGEPAPFRPVLRGVLVTGGRPLALGGEDKIDARHLTRFLQGTAHFPA